MHARAFEPSANGKLATRFNNAGRSTDPFRFELGVAHAIAIPVQILQALPSFVVVICVTANGSEQIIEAAAIEFLMPAFSP